jgi:putative transposase
VFDAAAWEIRAKQRRSHKTTTRRDARLPVAPNVLDRQFEAIAPNQKWVADIMYIATFQGWLYLATMMNLFARKVVGWSMSPRMKTALVADALRMAVLRRCSFVYVIQAECLVEGDVCD